MKKKTELGRLHSEKLNMKLDDGRVAEIPVVTNICHHKDFKPFDKVLVKGKHSKYGPIYFVRGDAKNERGVRYALSLIGVQAETWTYNINGVGFMPIEDGYLYFGYRGSRLMRVPIDQQSWLPQIIMDTAIELQPTPPERIPSHFFEDTEEE